MFYTSFFQIDGADIKSTPQALFVVGPLYSQYFASYAGIMKLGYFVDFSVLMLFYDSVNKDNR